LQSFTWWVRGDLSVKFSFTVGSPSKGPQDTLTSKSYLYSIGCLLADSLYVHMLI
jgi:hypothetical protein